MSVCPVPGANRNLAPGEFPEAALDIESEQDGIAILGGGCFWCTEAVYQQLNGVTHVESGYAGGSQDTANYHAVCSGESGHAEVIRIEYDPQRIRFGQILRVFFSIAHDPTQLNRQGNDMGTQYRSVIFPQSEDQAEVARQYIAQLNEAAAFQKPIVTRIEQGEYFPAEEYHQNYAALNPAQPYIAAVAAPKVAKLHQKLPHWARDSAKSS